MIIFHVVMSLFKKDLLLDQVILSRAFCLTTGIRTGVLFGAVVCGSLVSVEVTGASEFAMTYNAGKSAVSLFIESFGDGTTPRSIVC